MMSENSSPNDTEDQITYFAKQERVYAKSVSGKYRNLKWIAMIVCLAIYYLVPFLRWDRGPNAADQAVLLDLSQGRAYFFWFEIWPQEVYILTGILIVAAIGLFFITSLLGRVWCGYLCFQTVWTDLFVYVERIIQGDRTKRKKLREGPWTFEKIWKLVVTHIIWIVIGFFTAGAFILYFYDAPTLIRNALNFDVSTTVLWFVGGLTASTYIMAGFAREQVCTFMCPYARFQSAMFDKDTLIIGYDQHRGEKRGKHKKGTSWDDRGHCIDCSLCVQVCPMGIDIRDGLQMECIACGLCIDACNGVMDKVGLDHGLIRYDSEERMEAKDATQIDASHLIRPRTFVYAIILCSVIGMMLYTLINRSEMELSVLHDRNPLYVQLSDGDIRNGYEIKVSNKTHNIKNYILSINGLPDADLIINQAGRNGLADHNVLTVAADRVEQYKIFVKKTVIPQSPIAYNIILTDQETGENRVYKTMFISRRK